MYVRIQLTTCINYYVGENATINDVFYCIFAFCWRIKDII